MAYPKAGLSQKKCNGVSRVKTVTKVGYVIDPNSAFRIRIDAIGQISPLNLESLVGSVERGDNQAPIRILAEQI